LVGWWVGGFVGFGGKERVKGLFGGFVGKERVKGLFGGL